jgi:tetratricopeptide (TPR) repeat protein
VVCLDRQDFSFAASLLERWLGPVQARDLDNRGLYLYGRSLVLSGDLRRLQGTLQDLMTAKRFYCDAHDVFTELDIPRRAAQIELSLAVVTEMAGRLTPAAARYRQLTDDERLGPADRTRALLWIGTALAKDGRNEFAIQVMGQAAERFEDLDEPEDWATAQQKLALAHRGAGDLTRALAYIDTARSNGRFETPLQRVQIDTAHGHILLTDPATRSAGDSVLDRASDTAIRYGLKHQLRSIKTVRNSEEYT